MTKGQPLCAGVDGCRGGWVVATRSGVRVATSIIEVLRGAETAIAIDMPIGLPRDGRRSCEPLARRYLSPRGTTIFPTPSRSCLPATTYAAACALSREASGRAISQQAWRILPKIKEIDEAITASDIDRLVEAHPECSFTAMNSGHVLVSKHTAEGLRHRQQLVRDHFGVIPMRLPGAQFDDVLDAYAVLWTAERFSRGDHFEFGARGGEVDERGLPMRIVV